MGTGVSIWKASHAIGGDGQPSQIDFENSFIVALLRALDDDDEDDRGTRPVGGSGDDPPRRIFVEDEGNRVGNVGLPHPLRIRMNASY